MSQRSDRAQTALGLWTDDPTATSCRVLPRRREVKQAAESFGGRGSLALATRDVVSFGWYVIFTKIGTPARGPPAVLELLELESNWSAHHFHKLVVAANSR